jgi:hypothetical protein
MPSNGMGSGSGPANTPDVGTSSGSKPDSMGTHSGNGIDDTSPNPNSALSPGTGTPGAGATGTPGTSGTGTGTGGGNGGANNQ